MPPPSHRKVAFSAKKKKEQIKAKRERKRNADKYEESVSESRGKSHFSNKTTEDDEDSRKEDESADDEAEEGNCDDDGKHKVEAHKLNEQPPVKVQSKGYDPNRYRLYFKSETNEDVEYGKKLSRDVLTLLPETATELDLDDVYRPGSYLDMPKRPCWDYTMSREALDHREERYFKKYVEHIFENYSTTSISFFELNLETWRQLWRVVEMSDIVLLIADIRHPALHYSPALYDYVVKDLKKHMILVLNKVDLVPPSLVIAWREYFKKLFPCLHVICFTSFPKEAKEREKLNEDPTLRLQKKRRQRATAAAAVGPKQLLAACEEIVQGRVDLNSWKRKIEDDVSDSETSEETGMTSVHVEDTDTAFHQHQLFKDGILTIGCCGYPNVGKSSLINGLVGKKVVSVSRTPGHTKHFQTIFLTPAVKLCDSPGLVFPSLVSKPLQVLAGIYPVAQLREPYTAIHFLAERLNLPLMLKLKHPDVERNEKSTNNSCLKWSAFDICDAWAEKRGFLTAKAARHDVYRAANHLLRMTLEGRICLFMKPPGYCAHKDEWLQHPDTAMIEGLQEMHRRAVHFSEEEEDELDEDDEYEEKEYGEQTKDDDDDDEDTNLFKTANPYALLADDN